MNIEINGNCYMTSIIYEGSVLGLCFLVNTLSTIWEINKNVQYFICSDAHVNYF